ncbi:16S rRNA (cytosine(1402)-N(4))-methyltransferase RsmH [Candidatus Mycoplasma haematominutum]|uniref:16S rRNA (cytosine(1402)-N(4))-methyltransferase RsmH n=1 Tax=Candidatus Mycoplasma haematominutum TaxID=209446 RepID=UPI00030FB98A|nr:16S rRNA (cytosine(1402)-N(4))-methyltransferase RsmH [Candidatus Mycoplasma haematominutum]
MHVPVLLKEVLEHWIVSPSGFYIDCTFGRGGHTKALLQQLSPDSAVLGIDIDPNSSEPANSLQLNDSRFQFLNANYSSLYRYWALHQLPQADGILFDLGFSTFQLNDPSRNFSYNGISSGLELRYGVEGVSVYTILNDYSEKKLSKILKHYGNIKNSEKLVRELVEYRKKTPIKELSQLKEIVSKANLLYTRKNKNPLKLIFQALRIECNSELDNLRNALEKVGKILKLGGKLLIITFHSLEDEVVREWAKKFTQKLKIIDLGIMIPPMFKMHPNSPILPSAGEVEKNWASRSAKLWVFEKTKDV